MSETMRLIVTCGRDDYSRVPPLGGRLFNVEGLSRDPLVHEDRAMRDWIKQKSGWRDDVYDMFDLAALDVVSRPISAFLTSHPVATVQCHHDNFADSLLSHRLKSFSYSYSVVVPSPLLRVVCHASVDWLSLYGQSRQIEFSWRTKQSTGRVEGVWGEGPSVAG